MTRRLRRVRRWLRRRRFLLAGSLLALVAVGTATAVSPIGERWADMHDRSGIYLATLLGLYTLGQHLAATWSRRT